MNKPSYEEVAKILDYNPKIGIGGKYHHIGYFKSLDEAIGARDKAIKKLHGKFAKV